MPRRPKQQDAYFNPDWQSQADAARAEAAKLSDGPAKEALLRKARQLETATHMKEWLTSPGLTPPSS